MCKRLPLSVLSFRLCNWVRLISRLAMLSIVGKWAIHHKQVTLANEVFTPFKAAVAEAREILETMKNPKPMGKAPKF